MFPKRISILINVIGLILGALGLFLPWGEQCLKPWIMTESNCMLGIELALGQLTFAGWIVTVLFQILFTVRNQKYLLIFVMGGGIVITICSSVWIVNPGTLAPSGPYLYKALYGAYTSLISGILILAGTISGSYTVKQPSA